MLALMEKGVAFNSHYLDLLNFDQHRPDYLAINPQGTIPAMLPWAARAHRVDCDHGIRGRGFSRPTADAARCARPLARALVDEVHGPVARPELFHDRLERVRGPGRALQGSGGPQGGDRAHPAAGAPRRLAQGDLRAVQRRGNAGVPTPRGAGHPHARAGTLRSVRGSPAISTAWPTSTASIWLLRCRCRSRRCPTTSSRPTSCAGCVRSMRVRPPRHAGPWAAPSMAKRVTILEQPHIGRSTPA